MGFQIQQHTCNLISSRFPGSDDVVEIRGPANESQAIHADVDSLLAVVSQIVKAVGIWIVFQVQADFVVYNISVKNAVVGESGCGISGCGCGCSFITTSRLKGFADVNH